MEGDFQKLIVSSFFQFVQQNTTTRENETLLAVGTAYVQGEDVAARGRVLLFSIDRTADNSRTLVSSTTWLLAYIFLFFFLFFGAK